MASKKKVVITRPPLSDRPVYSTQPLTHLSVDYGREDINNIARKINEIIDYLNN
jgi:hypothetical protein